MPARDTGTELSTESGFRPCGVIPTYNNPETILRVVQAVTRQLPNVVVVDDGGNEAAQLALSAVKDVPGVTVHHRVANGGKGAAVKDGLRVAAELGFTHALQVDADGQHDLDDVTRFLDEARAHPEHMVLGHPIFDASVPRSRLRGRQISIFWVNVETFGRTIVDPLCGFRVYPIHAALASGTRGNFMDFDPEIAVRMVWDGVPVKNLATRVRYLTLADGGISHFDLLWDNVRISLMHTRLCLEALIRLPLLWLRRAKQRTRMLETR